MFRSRWDTRCGDSNSQSSPPEGDALSIRPRDRPKSCHQINIFIKLNKCRLDQLDNFTTIVLHLMIFSHNDNLYETEDSDEYSDDDEEEEVQLKLICIPKINRITVYLLS